MYASEILFRPVTELAALLKARKLSPVEVVRAFLERIEAVNPKVNAFLTVTADRALEQARQAEKDIASRRYRGPLHGIPYAPKDLIATAGVRTTNGSKVTSNWIPNYESTVTSRLNKAGAILIGKLNLLEFAMGSGQKGLAGPARNPWDLAYSPSGSSSGSGAALAAGMVPLTLGSDTGGSIRGPAKSCGVAGLKPTYGRVSLYGVTTLSWTLDHVGPMARTVAGVALMLQAIAGSDPNDRNAAAVPAPDYTKALTGNIKGLRFGVPSAYFFEHVRPETAAALHEAISRLKQLGAVQVDVQVRQPELASSISSVILGSESAAFHQKRLREHADLLDPLVRERLEAGSLYSAVDYVNALRLRTQVMEEMRRVFGTCDVLVLPAGNAAPKIEEEIAGTDAPTDPPRAPRPDTFNLANVAGIPALVLPCGFTAGPPSLPLGIQFCARPFDEATLFRVGHAYQSATNWHKRTAPLDA
ncbi:MAG: Asp-tRNA(Asn)/Glu-tRNA(Gln) amidotransferase GatCAB subunit A [Bryobacterales bacterium]|nr:Asp-tRNA(Asn)/Glu-tRNA(Gln) amidotransferase GatCAB subunit A [Bryobacterales bacterium]